MHIRTSRMEQMFVDHANICLNAGIERQCGIYFAKDSNCIGLNKHAIENDGNMDVNIRLYGSDVSFPLFNENNFLNEIMNETKKFW